MRRWNSNKAGILLLLQILFFSSAAVSSEYPEKEPWKHVFDIGIKRAAGAVYDGKFIWVSDLVNSMLVALDPETGDVKKEIRAPGPRPVGLAWDGRLLWVSDREEKFLFGVDPARELVTRRIESPCEQCMGLAWDGNYLWTSDGKKIHQLTTEDGTTIRSFSSPPFTGKSRATEQLGIAWARGSLWISDRHRDRVYRVDPQNGMVLDILSAPGPYAAGIAVIGGSLYLVDREKKGVFSIDTGGIPMLVRSNPRVEDLFVVYELGNFGPDTVETSEIFIAVPANLPGQEIRGDIVFEPPPAGFVVDQWGQKLARFVVKDLEKSNTMKVSMRVSATLYDLRYHIDPGSIKSLSSMPARMRRYLADGTKYAVRHPFIVKSVKEAVGKENNAYRKMRLIAKYIQDRMHYELAGGWNIAPTVLERGSGSCSEYTFVFISMCRAAGIPARYSGAIVVRGDDASSDDIFHRWPEVYLPGVGWIPADVQHADKPSPEDSFDPLSSLVNRFVITTSSGGPSSVLGWTYNGAAKFTCKGRCHVVERFWGDWSPGKKPASSVEEAEKEACPSGKCP